MGVTQSAVVRAKSYLAKPAELLGGGDNVFGLLFLRIHNSLFNLNESLIKL